MRCHSLIVCDDRRRKGTGKQYQKMRIVGNALFPGSLEVKAADCERIELCQGRIIATIKAVDEPTWGGTYASLRLEYRCEKCSDSVIARWYGLPETDEDLSKLVTSFIEKM